MPVVIIATKIDSIFSWVNQCKFTHTHQAIESLHENYYYCGYGHSYDATNKLL